ncbi:MAG: cell division protein FtsL [Deltaproteobacteria bacterium]|nr:cell division protein FtsL [Deltaproteobacteria bacterium]
MGNSTVSVHPIDETKVLQKQRVSSRVRVKTQGPSIMLSGLFLLLILSIIFYVWTRVQVVQFGYEISSALNEKEAAIIAHNELKLEIATLRSAQQVEREAREKLGMDLPRKDQLIIIR